VIREIAEMLQGRKRVLNDTPRLEEIMTLLLRQNPNVKGNVNFNGGEDYVLTDAPPEMMIQHVQKNFGMVGGGEYLRIRHRAYKGRKDEKHHIDFAMGLRYSTYTDILHHGKQMRYEAPFRKMTLDFLVIE
jgi:hypothetical protein